MDVERVIEGLGDRFDADETAIIARMLREYSDTIPYKQLMSEIGFALAAHRLSRPPDEARP